MFIFPGVRKSPKQRKIRSEMDISMKLERDLCDSCDIWQFTCSDLISIGYAQK